MMLVVSKWNDMPIPRVAGGDTIYAQHIAGSDDAFISNYWLYVES
jgi:hypothetical protein